MRFAFKRLSAWGLAVAALAGAGPALGKDAKPNAAKVLDSLQACQEIAEPGQRLACYDSQMSALKQVRAQDPDLSSARPQKREFKPIESTLTNATELQPGVWLLVLADHTVWRTDDDVRFFPRQGDSVRITRGAFGSFMASIGKEQGVRVKLMH